MKNCLTRIFDKTNRRPFTRQRRPALRPLRLEELEPRLAPAATVQFVPGTIQSTSTFSIPVTLTGTPNPNTAVTVPFSVSGSAMPGVDYTLNNFQVNFAIGQTTSYNISGTLVSDPGASNRTLIFTLLQPTSGNASLGSSTVENLTITQSSSGPTATFAPKPRFLPAVKSLLTTLGNECYQFGQSVALETLGGNFDADPELGATCIAVGLFLQKLGMDPPDPNYTVVAQPVIPSLPPVEAGGTVTQAEANAANALNANLDEQIGLGQAISTAINRANTAAPASNTADEQMQLIAANGFTTQLSTFVAAAPALLTNLQAALTAAGFSQTVTAAQASTFESNLKASGLPTTVTASLTQLGLSATDIITVAGVLENLDPNQVAGNIPAILTAPTFLSNLQSAASSLQMGLIHDELGAYRASDGSWSLDSDGTLGFNSATDQVFFSFSPPGVVGVAGDWTGSGNTEVGDFNPATGVWHLDLAGTGAAPGANETFQFGQAGDKPVVGDWTGNGVTNIGVFRANPDGTGEFILDTNGDHVLDAGDTSFSFGLANDRIVIGDWNGAGKDEVGVFREAVASGFPAQDAGDAVFSLDTNGNQTFDSGDQVLLFGRFTDGLIVGDWNGGGKTELGVYREAVASGFPQQDAGDAIFSLDTNGDGTFDAGDAIFLYGLDSDQFVSGHWAVTPPLQPEGTPQAQYAANGPGSGMASPLTETQLRPVSQQAMAAWAADGANVSQLEAVQVTIGTLDNNLVGETSGNQITIDATADGWGWNTDTSGTDFTSTGPNGLQATPGSAAAGEMDLLTVVEHEYGHVLGLSDVNPLTQPSSLMASTLPVGVRRNPTVVADAVFASGLLSPM